jgi:hypothetical protein
MRSCRGISDRLARRGWGCAEVFHRRVEDFFSQDPVMFGGSGVHCTPLQSTQILETTEKVPLRIRRQFVPVDAE